MCGGGLGRSQGIVHITWDGKQSNILVLLGRLGVIDNSETFVFSPFFTVNTPIVYTCPPGDQSHTVFWKTIWRVVCCTYLSGLHWQ